MFRSIFDHPQGDIFSFTSVTKDKIIWFVVACYHKPDNFIFSNWGKGKKYLPEDGQKLSETCWRILRFLKQYDHFNVLF